MNTRTTMPPVRKTVTVKQPVDRAFALFTARIADWRPGTGASAAEGTVVLEPRPQGKVYQRGSDGSIEFWAGHDNGAALASLNPPPQCHDHVDLQASMAAKAT
jgi:hypothetical protein